MNQSQPPPLLPAGYDIIIDPKLSGQCILNVPQRIAPMGQVVIRNGKKLVVKGDLNLQD
jgi:hypothetical protein